MPQSGDFLPFRAHLASPPPTHEQHLSRGYIRLFPLIPPGRPFPPRRTHREAEVHKLLRCGTWRSSPSATGALQPPAEKWVRAFPHYHRCLHRHRRPHPHHRRRTHPPPPGSTSTPLSSPRPTAASPSPHPIVPHWPHGHPYGAILGTLATVDVVTAELAAAYSGQPAAAAAPPE